jgi:membrane fusion protein, copper/silver efflux system
LDKITKDDTMQALSLRILVILFCFLLLPVGTVFAADADVDDDHSPETIWTCSMHPQIQLPEAGQCPICFMDLIEVQIETGGNRESLRQISFDSRARKLAEVEVQAVIRGTAMTEIRMVGKVDYDETRMGTITSWVNGRIDKLFVDYTGSRVRRGQPMVKIYSPELLTAQAELIQASVALKRSEKSGNEIIRKTAARTLAASREKLRLLGLDNKQLQAIEKQGRPTDHIILTAPLSGIVIKKDVNEGMYVKTGSPIYTLADLDRVWVVLEAYESDLQAITLGQQVHFTVESYPGTAFQGEVAYIDPLVNIATRTVRVRLNVDNGDAKLKPGMFVRAISSAAAIVDPADIPLLIPVSAPLLTGKRALVYVQLPDQPGVYVGREVVLGPRQGAFYQVKSGLSEGELVVTRGNFKIDSAIQLQARPSMMNPYFEEASDQDASYPSLFLSRLDLLNQDFGEFSKEVHEKNSERQDAALRKFKGTLGSISGDGLGDDDRLSWQELSMLLGSDIVLLFEAENNDETEQLYAVLAEHFHQLRSRFDLNDVAATRLGSPELKTGVSDLISRYLELQLHLASDNYEAAQKESINLVSKADAVIVSLQETGEELAVSLAVSLTENSQLLTAANSLDELRAVFFPLSQTLIRIVETFGSTGDTSLYIQFCPMAFGNEGATWLAASEEINNPYFGLMMQQCGEVQKQITP